MRRETDEAKTRGQTLSVRALLFGAILLAGTPGVVFGAMLAWNAYQLTSQQDTMVRTDEAARAGIRIDEALRSAKERTASFALSNAIRRPQAECVRIYRDVLDTQTLFTSILRADATGRVTCATAMGGAGRSVATADWFVAAKKGSGDFVTGMSAAAPTSSPSILVVSRMENAGRFEGAVLATIAPQRFEAALAKDIGKSGGALLFDRNGAIVAQRLGSAPAEPALAAGRAALSAANGKATRDGVLAQRVGDAPDGFQIVSLAPQTKQAELGLRAALIVLAPLLVAALTVIAMSAAMNRWVLRWFGRLRDAAQDYARGRYAPVPMEGAPAEISTLAQAFDAAVAQSRARERDLASALASNVSLTRELHHRVKNNLQVLSSLISRQQRRASDPDVREALSEARARMAPVALAYRFVDPPDERIAIDVDAYLGELARQLHIALGGVARQVSLTLDVKATPMPIDEAVNMGLIVAEALVAGYASAAEGAQSTLSCLSEEGGMRRLAVRVTPAEPGAGHGLDEELARELARQLHGEIAIVEGGLTLDIPPR